jgi:hypothetical protein
MALWQAKTLGVLFGGVTDEDNNEETLESKFWNDLCESSVFGVQCIANTIRYTYQLTSDKGKWSSLLLRKPKQKKAKGKKAQSAGTKGKLSSDDEREAEVPFFH